MAFWVDFEEKSKILKLMSDISKDASYYKLYEIYLSLWLAKGIFLF